MFQVKILYAFLYRYASYAFFHIVRRYEIPTVKVIIMSISICFCYSRSFRFIFSFSEPSPNLHIRNAPSKFRASENYVHVIHDQCNRKYFNVSYYFCHSQLNSTLDLYTSITVINTKRNYAIPRFKNSGLLQRVDW